MQREETKPLILDMCLRDQFSQTLAIGHGKLLFYVYQGVVNVDGVTVKEGQLALLSSGSELMISAEKDSRLLLLGGQPLNEPVAQYGPFVMNTNEEIVQAMADYRNGELI